MLKNLKLVRSIAFIDVVNPYSVLKIHPDFSKKHRGCNLRDIAAEDPSFISWIAGADSSPEVRTIAARALEGEFPEQKDLPPPAMSTK